jgi:hypothetical protein
MLPFLLPLRSVITGQAIDYLVIRFLTQPLLDSQQARDNVLLGARWI